MSNDNLTKLISKEKVEDAIKNTSLKEIDMIFHDLTLNMTVSLIKKAIPSYIKQKSIPEDYNKKFFVNLFKYVKNKNKEENKRYPQNFDMTWEHTLNNNHVKYQFNWHECSTVSAAAYQKTKLKNIDELKTIICEGIIKLSNLENNLVTIDLLESLQLPDSSHLKLAKKCAWSDNIELFNLSLQKLKINKKDFFQETIFQSLTIKPIQNMIENHRQEFIEFTKELINNNIFWLEKEKEHSIFEIKKLIFLESREFGLKLLNYQGLENYIRHMNKEQFNYYLDLDKDNLIKKMEEILIKEKNNEIWQEPASKTIDEFEGTNHAKINQYLLMYKLENSLEEKELIKKSMKI